jgi:hypothetical protein
MQIIRRAESVRNNQNVSRLLYKALRAAGLNLEFYNFYAVRNCA